MATDIQLHKQQAQELSNKLWAIANDLRGTMDASTINRHRDFSFFLDSGAAFIVTPLL